MPSRFCVMFLSVLCACRNDGVDRFMDASPLPTDAATGTATDASRELPRDATTDPSIDATLQSTPDAATDATLDASADAMPDATVDAAIDASLDATTNSPDGSVAPVSLNVTIAGSGSGNVTSIPVGVTCSSDTCSADFDQGTVITLSAESSTGSTFTGWSGACTGPSAECMVDLDGATNVTAAFELQNFTLLITKSGDGAGTVTGNGLDCGTTCMVSLPHGTAVTLTSTASSAVATLSTLTEWIGAGCSGDGPCMFTITGNTTVDAAYKLAPNLMFTTSATYDGNLGGLAGADARCQALATAHSLAGAYRAYLGATGTDAPARFAGASGWTRVDGQPLVSAIGDFGTTTLQHAPVLDEGGNDLSAAATVRVWTGTQSNTSYFGQNCNNAGTAADWSATVTQTMSGVCTATNANVLVGGSVFPCGTAIRLNCFGIERAATIP
jgi:hypothetical protein